jgi:hypothetical protein
VLYILLKTLRCKSRAHTYLLLTKKIVPTQTNLK